MPSEQQVIVKDLVLVEANIENQISGKRWSLYTTSF